VLTFGLNQSAKLKRVANMFKLLISSSAPPQFRPLLSAYSHTIIQFSNPEAHLALFGMLGFSHL